MDKRLVETVLKPMGAYIDHVEKRGQYHTRVWIANEDNVRVCWITYHGQQVQGFRFLRSIYRFDRDEFVKRFNAYAKGKPYARFIPGVNLWWVHTRNPHVPYSVGRTLEQAYKYFQLTD